MTSTKIISFVAIAIIGLFVLYDVTFVMNFGGVNEIERPDPAVEARFEQCYLERDDEMHRVAFDTIDNPDVQREYISANRARIARECRAENPTEIIRADERSAVNIIDLQPRFW